MAGITAGCSLREAVIDGFLGGITSVVSTVVVQRLPERLLGRGGHMW
ncbi:MAG: hypothetical protein V3W34_19490 [Phycisphaerae bacterium]